MLSPPGTPAQRDVNPDLDPSTVGMRERFGAFYTFYIGLFILVFAYLITVRIAEAMLDSEFQKRVDRAIVVTRFEKPVAAQIADRVDQAVHESAWVRIGGVDVSILVLAQDGRTWLYVDGFGAQVPPDAVAPADVLGEWMDYLPATANVRVTLPHNSLVSNLVLIVYSTVLMIVVYVTNRRLTRRESVRLSEALESRNVAAGRAADIARELDETRTRLAAIEPVEQERSEEIAALQRERESLEAQLTQLAHREEALRGDADRAVELADEVSALEDLLNEVTTDLETKDEAIDLLEQSLDKARRTVGKTRSKDASRLARRFRTLYKSIEVDDRAIDDIVALGDEAHRLKAEEAIKRLAEDAGNVAVRRKVGGLPEGIHVFELGFAGKGRIYYARGQKARFRILLVGAKNTQSTDLDYLRRLPKDSFA